MRLKDWFKSGLQYAAIIIFASAIYGVLMEPTKLTEMVSMAAMYMLLFGGAMSLLFSISVYKVMLPVSLGFGSTRREAFVGIQCYRVVYMALVSAAAVGLYLLGGKMGLTELKVLAPIGIGLMPLMTAVGAVIGMVGSRFGKGVMAAMTVIGSLIAVAIMLATLILCGVFEEQIGSFGLWMMPVAGLLVYGLVSIFEYKSVKKYSVKL